MTITPRNWRGLRPAKGPFVATTDDIGALNEVFAEAFTDRYRRDGLTGVRVPPLNPAIWRYAIEDAGDGALCWRDERNRIVAFNMVHHSGAEGWMGPLCVRPEYQGFGLGKTIVEAGQRWLEQHHVRVIGLETMPRTMDNIGFYSGLGFVPGPLTITLTLDVHAESQTPVLLSRLTSVKRDAALEGCRALSERVLPGYNFTRELELTERLELGDTLLLGPTHAPVGFVLCHTAPLVEGRTKEELRVLKLVLSDRADLTTMIQHTSEHARRSGARRVAYRVQGVYNDMYRTLVGMGARVRWTDLRMSVHGWSEKTPAAGLVLSNWEI
ncbi:MAG: GNAT family N-acetyltransferase [Phycisphaerae bacterium]|nr:GNAT family N-acetyltransferase [Gemmatimonadaceae bacterium]